MLKEEVTEAMSEVVKIVECPRDAWQGLAGIIPAERKAEYLRSLIAAGFRHLDAVSFVSPGAIPQMADSESVLQILGPQQGVEVIGIVVNERGAERAIETEAVTTLGFPYSISSEFLLRNQHQTPEQAIETLESIVERADGAQLKVAAYVSMAFGNPYGDAWTAEEVVDACDLLVESGVRQILLADTVGLATADQVAEVVTRAIEAHPEAEVGVHLHARPAEAAVRIRAAYEAGCRRFDAAIGGLGGCPFAQDLLVGNIPTEVLLQELAALGATLPLIGGLDELIRLNAAIARDCGAKVQ
jgi:hydroxymethylglutaryl-CoA lyase